MRATVPLWLVEVTVRFPLKVPAAVGAKRTKMVSLTTAVFAGIVCVVANVVPLREISNGAAVVNVKASLTLMVLITTY